MSNEVAFLSPDPRLESRVREIGAELFRLMEAHPAPGIFSKKGAYAKVMEWTMRDPAFKAQLFRFVDVLPALTSSSDIVRHLQEYLGDQAVALHPTLKAGLVASSIAPVLVAAPIKSQITSMAGQFVTGETTADLIRRIRDNTARGIATTIDLLGEAVVSEGEADHFLERNLEVLDAVSAHFRKEPKPAASDLGPDGPLPRLNLSVKVSALTPEVHPADPEKSIESLKKRLRPILRRAAQAGALINFDMEGYKLKDLTLSLFQSILEEPEFRETPPCGIALQAYLRECEADLLRLIAWARTRRRRIDIRLVKGAYWDSETILAQQREWPLPVWSKKPESDANYEKLTVLLLENLDAVRPAFASHNVRTCAHAVAQAECRKIDPRAYEFQALYGMADELKAALLERGHRVREYCTIGELLPGMAYLVRRLLENTSNEGFLRIKNEGEASMDELLRNPVERIPAAPEPLARKPRPSGSFVNAAGLDFSLAAQRDRQRTALQACEATRLGKRHPLIIDGRRISDREWVTSVNPARPGQVIGHWARGTRHDADHAVAAAMAAFPAWRATPVEHRAAILERAADLMECRRFELNALLILEAGKPWMEADSDTSEAVDFCRFYAHEMRRLGQPLLTQAVPGEHCVQRWMPRGVGVAIAPWNFPLAILAGMTVAPLVAGNCVVMKPAEQTTVIASALMEILVEAGVPAGALHFLPGQGEEIGAYLAAHPQVDFLTFTGSRSIGCAIWEAAGRTPPGQHHLKKVVCEMGGKNALIIDSDADLDEAIPAILYSAFGFAGQKCSALSRLIVLDAVYDRLIERLVSACPSYTIGDPADPSTLVNPVIDAQAQKNILDHIEEGKKEAKLTWQAILPPAALASGGYYVPPTVFTSCKPEHAIVRGEIFGPVLAILRAKNLDQAFALANASDYALTGGIFSRSPVAIERAKEEFLVGNLYVNRGCTGAVVERHPFGGFRMSGGGTKAGGKGYLENFMFSQTIAENVMRRGFAPSEEVEGDAVSSIATD